VHGIGSKEVNNNRKLGSEKTITRSWDQRRNVHLIVDLHFESRGLKDVLLNRVDGEKAKHPHLVLLPDAVRSVLLSTNARTHARTRWRGVLDVSECALWHFGGKRAHSSSPRVTMRG
jgi:hypothetical protein